MKQMRILAAACVVLAGGAAHAHHSFAVFFDADRMITVKGTVADFQFRNPHGIIRLNVTEGAVAGSLWKAETNSPSILERRGWTRDILKAGDAIVVQGWPARDGSNYLRMRSVRRADGTPVGVPFEQAEQK